MSHELVAFLGGGVKAFRIVHLVVFTERSLGVSAINTARTGIDKRIAMIAATFEYIEKTHYVVLHIASGMVYGISHTRLGGKVANHIKTFAEEKIFKSGVIGYVKFQKLQVAINSAYTFFRISYPESAKTFKFKFRSVVVVKIVNAHNFIATLCERKRKVIANKSGSSGNKHFHYFLRFRRLFTSDTYHYVS